MAKPETIQINELGNPLLLDGGLGLSTPNPFDTATLTQSDLGDNNGIGNLTPAITLSNVFVFNISSNQKQFTTKVNDEITPNSKVVRISRDSLLKDSQRIDVLKEGFSTGEYYIVELEADGSPVILNSKFPQPLGLSTKNVILTKYVNNTIESTQSIAGNVSVELNFKLNKVSDIDLPKELKLYTITFDISGVNNSVSVLKNSTNSAEFFPKVGSNVYEDIEGTSYVIRSSNIALYRISSINFSGLNAPQNLVAQRGESLEVSVKLNSDYKVSITTEAVRQEIPATNPQIQLINSEARTYNINSKVGVQLMFRKNESVKTITIIIGDDVLEFDNLDTGDLCGITIPHRVFRNIGKYNIKVFPFSLDDYENEVRPKTPAETIQTKPIEIKYGTTEELVINSPKSEDIFNPYNPIVGGSGGGLNNILILDNGGDIRNTSFVNTPKNREAIR